MAEALLLVWVGVLAGFLAGVVVQRSVHTCKTRVVHAARMVDGKVQPDLPRRERRARARKR